MIRVDGRFRAVLTGRKENFGHIGPGTATVGRSRPQGRSGAETIQGLVFSQWIHFYGFVFGAHFLGDLFTDSSLLPICSLLFVFYLYGVPECSKNPGGECTRMLEESRGRVYPNARGKLPWITGICGKNRHRKPQEQFLAARKP